MESNCTNCNENVYFACRKKAASYNEKLNSRESAAELLGISPSTLANHELGITKSVPVDTVVMMADLYHAPELKKHVLQERMSYRKRFAGINKHR